jgi:hypothetical protein
LGVYRRQDRIPQVLLIEHCNLAAIKTNHSQPVPHLCVAVTAGLIRLKETPELREQQG